MKRLSQRRLEQVSDCLQATYRAQDLDEFARTVPAAILSVIGADISTYSEVNPPQRRVSWHHEPVGAPLLDLRATFQQLMQGDPLIAWYSKAADGRAVKISDFLVRRQFHALPVYNEFYRHLSVEHQIAFLLDTVKPTFVGVTLNRSTSDFTEEDRFALNLVRPHLVQAYQNAVLVSRSRGEIALMTQGIEDAGRAIITLSEDGAILRTTTKARDWLAFYFGWPRRGSLQQLPDTLNRWLSVELRQRADAVAYPARPFAIDKDGRTLNVTALAQGRHTLLLMEEHREPRAVNLSVSHALHSVGLSPRESEVLAWVAQGKTNPEIGIILRISSRTVQTHLDHIYHKLDVQSRAAATAKAIETVSLGTPSA